MTIEEELRLIADSIQMVMPFQAARLRALADRVDPPTIYLGDADPPPGE